MTFHFHCSLAHLPQLNDDGNYDTTINDSDDNDNDKQQATSDNLPVDTMQQCIASSEAGWWQHCHISTQLKQQQALHYSGFGLNNNSCWLAETAKALAISIMGGVTNIGSSTVSGTATAK